MSLVRTARATGHSLWPEGCSTIDDVSNDLISAIAHASNVINWRENMSKEEVPPEWMWPFNEELDEWFDEVEFQRSQKYGGGSDADDADMDRNEYAKDLEKKRNRRG